MPLRLSRKQVEELEARPLRPKRVRKHENEVSSVKPSCRFGVSGIIVTLPGIPPGLNGPDGLMRMHHRVYMQERDHWQDLVGQACSSYVDDRGRLYPFHSRPRYQRCFLVYTIFTSRFRDWDNALASFKPLGDALVEAGLIADDNPDVVSYIEVRQTKVKHRKEHCVTISIHPC